MKILLLGNGGREHTFAWKIAQSELCTALFIAPGNAGTAAHGTNVNVAVTDFEAIKKIVVEKGIEMVIVGPEVPLVEGIWDYFKSDVTLKEVKIIGPSKEAAQLEGSKKFAKSFMQSYQIPTAGYRAFDRSSMEEGLEYIKNHALPVVLKADGLAAGKGVLICEDHAIALEEFQLMLNGKFKKASEEVVVEEFLKGIEFSVFVLTDGKHYQLLPVAKDYKRIGEGDTGLNTGGMGAVSPVSFVDEVLMERVISRIIEPTLKGIQENNFAYQGFIFFGLIAVDGEPYVIEYNCRMGDPETEVVFPRIQTDIVSMLNAAVEENLKNIEVKIDDRAATTVILVSGGYPEAYEKGKPITGIAEVKDSIVFHAGTKNKNDQIVTNGGRVLAITSLAENYKNALQISYSNAAKISFDKKYYRKDIGFDL